MALIILASFALAIYFYPLMPERIASHWNAQGQADGYMTKFWGLFFMPFLSLAMFLFFLIIPKVDPLKSNIEEFRKFFDWFIVLLLLFLLYLYILTLWWNVGGRFNMVQFLVPAFGILFYYCGLLIEKAKRNWFIGIRTPWTLSSENVWNKTHNIGGKLFRLSGVVALVGFVFPSYALAFVIIPIISASLFTFIYSYIEFQKEARKS